MIKVYCDRCGADITGDVQFGEVTGKFYSTPYFEDEPTEWLFGLDGNQHYCTRCMDEIRDFIRTRPKNAKERDWWDDANVWQDEADSMAVTQAPADEPETYLNRVGAIPLGDAADDGETDAADDAVEEETAEENADAAEPVEAEEPEPKSEFTEGKKRRSIDYGKIKALLEAGWNREEIAKEMGMTRKGIDNAVWYAKKHPEVYTRKA